MSLTSKLWVCLQHVRSLRFSARSANPNGWNGNGSGVVGVQSTGADVMLFNESGVWQPTNGREIKFTNVFRWSILAQEAIRLEHLRFGIDHPVFLFDIVPGRDGEWASANPHQCRDDCYSAHLHLQSWGCSLCWTIAGPKKQEMIEYSYFV